jgi:uncharacterized protein (TIGR02145 family)
MKLFQSKYIVIAALSIAGLSHCVKEEEPKTPPIASFKLAPSTGLTTTIFNFDASASQATNEDDTMLFIRWDWDNDSIWDTGFSRAKAFTYRYYKPGTYTPRMEIRNEAGLSDTMELTVQVGRGYSPPRPSFTITPASGNLRTEFVFDATHTRDDEDSLSTLRFRWDWEGDGIYDTEYTDQTVINHYYKASSIYNATLEVLDPQGFTGITKRPVSVSLSNLRLVPQITWSPEKPTTSDTVMLDASSSYDPDNVGNTFSYRWNFTDDTDFDTEYLTDPVIGHQFTTEGDHNIILEIKDQWGLINQVKVKLFIGHSNLKPSASFITGYEYGNLTTNFLFDASGTTDIEDYLDLLLVRWDFESDGIWDTDFAKAKTVNRKYGAAGTYRVRMQVKDTGELTDISELTVFVSAGTNETGLVFDTKNSAYYGTVKIGSQWWMAENLNAPSTNKFCYSNSTANCNTYGGLYIWTDAMNGSASEKARGLCPQGWHIPTANEWQQLVDYYGGDLARTHLEVGGDSDFRMYYAGQRSTAGRSEMLNTVGNFWTSTKASGENAYEFSFQSDKDTYFRINLSQSYSFSVRCIKD